MTRKVDYSKRCPIHGALHSYAGLKQEKGRVTCRCGKSLKLSIGLNGVSHPVIPAHNKGEENEK